MLESQRIPPDPWREYVVSEGENMKPLTKFLLSKLGLLDQKRKKDRKFENEHHPTTQEAMKVCDGSLEKPPANQPPQQLASRVLSIKLIQNI